MERAGDALHAGAAVHTLNLKCKFLEEPLCHTVNIPPPPIRIGCSIQAEDANPQSMEGTLPCGSKR
jgi:hypothetical protein